MCKVTRSSASWDGWKNGKNNPTLTRLTTIPRSGSDTISTFHRTQHKTTEQEFRSHINRVLVVVFHSVSSLFFTPSSRRLFVLGVFVWSVLFWAPEENKPSRKTEGFFCWWQATSQPAREKESHRCLSMDMRLVIACESFPPHSHLSQTHLQELSWIKYAWAAHRSRTHHLLFGFWSRLVWSELRWWRLRSLLAVSVVLSWHSGKSFLNCGYKSVSGPVCFNFGELWDQDTTRKFCGLSTCKSYTPGVELRRSPK